MPATVSGRSCTRVRSGHRASRHPDLDRSVIGVVGDLAQHQYGDAGADLRGVDLFQAGGRAVMTSVIRATSMPAVES